MANEKSHWIAALPVALLWAVFLSLWVLIAVLYFTEKPLHYEGFIQFGGEEQVSSAGSNSSEEGVDKFFMRKEGSKTLEWNEADKVYFPSQGCAESAVRSAKIEDDSGKLQAAVCTCLDAEAGRGWYCWN